MRDIADQKGFRAPLGEYPTLYAQLRVQDWTVPELQPDSTAPDTVSLEDLLEAEAVSIHESPHAVVSTEGDTPLLIAKDVRLGRAPSRWGSAGAPGTVLVRKGDVAVVGGSAPAARVCVDDGVLLGPNIQVVRVNSKALDPHFLAGVLRAAVEAADGQPIDLYRVAVPRRTLAEQRRYGLAFEQLNELESAWERRRTSVAELVRLGFGGLAQGRLRPAAAPE